jgi:AGZA family xanthine/uracil permease-like MFS transporter
MFTTLGLSFGAMYICTALSAVVGCFLMAFLAGMPIAQAPGLGLNAFFVYTCCLGFGFTYANALVFVLFDGILFVLLTVTGLRKKIYESIPLAVRHAIGVGIGGFIFFIACQNSGLIVDNPSTLTGLVSFNFLSGGATWAGVMPVLVTMVTTVIICALRAKDKRGAVLIGILIGSVLYYLLGFTIPGFYDGFVVSLNLSMADAFKDFGTQTFGAVFREGFDFSGYLASHSQANLWIMLITSALAFCLVDMFDTLGTLYSACAEGGLLDEEGKPLNFEKCMLSDALATCAGAVFGTSTVTSYVESTSGIAAGAKSGLSSFVTGVLFILALVFTPIASLVPSCATAAALAYVGVIMMAGIVNINWKNIEIALPAFLTIMMMVLSYSISYGIAIGILAYVLVKIFVGKAREIPFGTWLIGALFIMMFVTH